MLPRAVLNIPQAWSSLIGGRLSTRRQSGVGDFNYTEAASTMDVLKREIMVSIVGPKPMELRTGSTPSCHPILQRRRRRQTLWRLLH